MDPEVFQIVLYAVLAYIFVPGTVNLLTKW